jgi:hypothetical protein
MTAMDGEPVSLAWQFWAATRTVDQHQPRGESWAPGTCRQCMPNGWTQLAWVERFLARARTRATA